MSSKVKKKKSIKSTRSRRAAARPSKKKITLTIQDKCLLTSCKRVENLDSCGCKGIAIKLQRFVSGLFSKKKK